jgi:hypothetical protein
MFTKITNIFIMNAMLGVFKPKGLYKILHISAQSQVKHNTFFDHTKGLQNYFLS